MRVPKALPMALVISAMACALPDAGAQTLRKVVDSNLITVSYRGASVPFSYLIAPNKPVGFAVDLTEAIVQDVRDKLSKPGLQVAYRPVTGQTRIPQLVDGTYDLECGSTTNTSARGKDVSFSISYFFAGTRLLTRKESGIRSYADQNRKAVFTTAGSTNEKVIRKLAAERGLDVKITLGKDYDDAFQMVESGQVAAFAMDDILLFGLRANSKDPGSLDIVGDALQVEPYGCMTRKDDPEFKALVDGTLSRLIATGEFARLYAKWFESPIPPKNINLNMPMSDALKEFVKNPSDRGVDACGRMKC